MDISDADLRTNVVAMVVGSVLGTALAVLSNLAFLLGLWGPFAGAGGPGIAVLTFSREPIASLIASCF